MRSTVLVILVAACGADHKGGPVEVCATGQTLIAYREGNGAWLTPQATNGRYVLPVSGDYEVVEVTVNSDGTFFTSDVRATAAETTPIDACPEMPQAKVAVTGTLNGSGMVFMDGYGNSPGSGSNGFSLEVTPGTHDLLATGAYPGTGTAAGNVVLQRGKTITGPADMGTIDLTAGMPLVQVPLTVTNATSSVSTYTYINTTVDDLASVAMTNNTTALVVPASLLQPTDKQYIFAFATGQSAQARYTGSQMSFTLLPPLAGITFAPGSTTASWTTLPSPYDGVYLFTFGQTSSQWVSATKGWLDVHGGTSLGFATDVPGYQPGWTIAMAMGAELALWVDDGDITYYASASPSAPVAAAAAAHRARVLRTTMR